MKVVKYVGGHSRGVGEVWGGTMATHYSLMKAFAGDPDYLIDPCFTSDHKGRASAIAEFIKGGDIIHVDNTIALNNMFKAGMDSPDVSGTMARSPLKSYGSKPEVLYTPEWFYKAKIMRLNFASEEGNEYLIAGLINKGVDTDRLIPDFDTHKNIVLWAGDTHRPAKNFAMFKEICENTILPEGFKFMVLDNYKVEYYWNMLKNVAVVINTSSNETFCNCAFEAMSSGVPVIWRKKLQGAGIHESAGIRVEYNVKAYSEAIIHLLHGDRFIRAGKEAREYVERYASLKNMNESYKKIYNMVVK